MKKTWRWFGPNDAVQLPMLRQIGVEGIVTALHHVPNGSVWSSEEIRAHKSLIESEGFSWSVVESLPVSESIKFGGNNRDRLISNYIKSLENLGKEGITTVCYNFMPVIDWVRTELNYQLPDGTSTLYFDKVRFAYFDLMILQRPGAEKDYSGVDLKKVAELHQNISEGEKQQLIDTIIVKTQGFINGNIMEGDLEPVNLFRQLIRNYEGIDKHVLRENLTYFLRSIMPVCEKYGINMCIHPDDPPFSLLGLPRIVTSSDDIAWILSAVDHPCNGLTFCAGSLSAGLHNDLPVMAKQFASRTRFLHLRSTNIMANGDFIEATHLEGRGQLIELVSIFETLHPGLPMRVDHGRMMLGDEDKGYHPGYPFHGRMQAFAQLEGVVAAVKFMLSNSKSNPQLNI